jgi:hypothetical protein
MPLAYALSGGIYFVQKANRHALFATYNKKWYPHYVSTKQKRKTNEDNH